MTALILQDSKNIPITYITPKTITKAHKTLAFKAMPWCGKPLSSVLSLLEKEKFLPESYRRKSAHFQEFYYHISRYKGREKNPLASLILRKIMVSISQSLEKLA